MKLTLKPEGRLIRTDWVYDEQKGEGSYVDKDVSDALMYFLFDPVTLDPALCLRDLFALLARNPEAAGVFKRDWGEDFVAEYVRVIGQAKPYTGEYDSNGIEYLELYRVWEIDEGELIGTTRLDFHGVGFELQEDVKQNDMVIHSKGGRIKWAIDFSPLGDLLNLPLRLDPTVVISENYKDVSPEYTVPEVLLGQVIRGVLWELSFHGSPEDMKKASAKLHETYAEVQADIAAGDVSKFVSLEDVLKDLEQGDNKKES